MLCGAALGVRAARVAALLLHGEPVPAGGIAMRTRLELRRSARKRCAAAALLPRGGPAPAGGIAMRARFASRRSACERRGTGALATRRIRARRRHRDARIAAGAASSVPAMNRIRRFARSPAGASHEGALAARRIARRARAASPRRRLAR